MKITFDEAKRQWTLKNRGLDFNDAPDVFSSTYLEFPDDRKDYGEPRFITFGSIRERPVAMIWTPRQNSKRIISMRYVHERELEARRRTLD